jgi:hypothetical protein
MKSIPSMKSLMQQSLLAFVLAALFLTACKKDKVQTDTPVLVNTPPTIVRLIPQDPTGLALGSQAISLRYQLNDNQALDSIIIREKIYAAVSNTLASDTIEIVGLLGGTSQIRDFTYIVPNIALWSKIVLEATVRDNIGQTATTIYTITVVDTSVIPEIYEIQTYTSDTIYSGLSSYGKGFFSFVGRTNMPTSLNRDLGEMSSVSGTFSATLASPNNNFNDAFVKARTWFNYDTLTYSTTYNAYYTGDTLSTIGPVVVGDVYIQKLTLVPHFAIFRITQVVDNPGDDDDFIVFDYKRSQN